MAVFALTFRIHRDAGYDDRYASTVEAIKSCCHGDEYWDEPTSFFLFENPSTSAKIAEWIEANSDFAPSKDLLTVINLTQKACAPKGNVREPQTLKRLMDKR
jgi:hypothetical protein